jgi:predicted SAM-dependent methyltransferase
MTMMRRALGSGARLVFSNSTLRQMRWDLQRARARLKRRGDRDVVPRYPKLHLGAGDRKVPGWLNVDVSGSDYDVDLGSGRLPWRTDSVECVVAEHTIEHLELHSELVPLLSELDRVLRPGGEIWLSCPDLEKICRSYVDHRMVDLIEDRRTRFPGYGHGAAPSSQFVNELFYQSGEHKNLFDLELLAWTLRSAGFVAVTRVFEADLLARFPEFPARNDDAQSLYVTAQSPRRTHAGGSRS